MRSPARAVEQMPRSGIREVMDLAAGRADVLHLEVGEPDFPTPPHVVEAAARAAADGFTRYTPNRGLVSLRELLCDKLERRNGIHAGVDDVVVTTGGVTALIEALMALVEPGEEVLIPDPGWPNCEMMTTALGFVPVRYCLDPNAAYEPDVEQLRMLAARPRAKLLIANSPGNPTGAVWRRQTVEEVAEIVREADLYLVSDEVYEEIVFDGEHVSPATFAPERVVSVYSFSKTYAMTGWRVGYAVAPPPIATLIAKVQETVVSCANSVAQKAAEAALAGPQQCVATMRDTYRSRRDIAAAALGHAGLVAGAPRGAFYILADVGRETDATAFARWLLAEHGVAVAPGETFGPAGAGLVRISLASPTETVEEGVRRLVRAVAGRRAARSPSVQHISE